MPTRRGIYLPDNNYGVLNSGYRPDGNEAFPNTESKNYDTIEVEMQFTNEVSESATEEAAITDGKNGHVMTNDNDQDVDEALSFYNSTYTHL